MDCCDPICYYQICGLHRWGIGERACQCTDCGCFNSCTRKGAYPREDWEMERQDRDLENQARERAAENEQLPPYPGSQQMQVPKPAATQN